MKICIPFSFLTKPSFMHKLFCIQLFWRAWRGKIITCIFHYSWAKKLIIKMMSTHVYFYTIFFLKPWFSEINGWWESGREWRDTGADPGVLQVCVCVFRGDTSFCVLSVTVPDWLPCFLFPVCTRTGYI